MPTITCLNGAVAGGRAAFSLACDFRIASENTKIQFNFSKIGLIPDMGAHYFLPRLVEESKSLELLYTGKMISAKVAKNIGLVNEVVNENHLSEYTYQYAKKFLMNSRYVYKEIKKLVKSNNRSLDEILYDETMIQAERFRRPEFKAFIEAF